MSYADNNTEFNTRHNTGTFGGDFQKIYEKLMNEARNLIDGIDKGTIRFKGAYSNFSDLHNVYFAVEPFIDSSKASLYNKYMNEILRKMKILAQEDKLKIKNDIAINENIIKTNLRMLDEIDRRTASIAEFESENIAKEKEKAESFKVLKATVESIEPVQEQQLKYSDLVTVQIIPAVEDFLNHSLSGVNEDGSPLSEEDMKLLKKQILETWLKKYHTVVHHSV